MAKIKLHEVDTDKIIERYLQKVGFTSKDFWDSQDIPIVNMRFVVLSALRDYFENKLTFDEIFNILQNLNFRWSEIEFSILDPDLKRATDSVSTFYKKVDKDEVDYAKKIIKNYYEKYKYLIKDFTS